MKAFIVVFLLLVLFGVATGVAFLTGGTVGHDFACKVVRYGKYVLRRVTGGRSDNDVMFPTMTVSQSARLHRAIKLTYVGDLILLREAVQRALCDDGTYDFVPMFKHVQDYFKTSDFTLGVFEGPCAGTGVSYSTSNYDDRIWLRLNFPDVYAKAVKNAGINFVTTANNHLLDCGIDGAMRTLDVLDKAGLSHTGSFRDKTEHDTVKILGGKGEKNCGVGLYVWL